MSAFNSEENIRSGRVEWHNTIQKAILDKGLDEEVAAIATNTTITEKTSYNNNNGHKNNDDNENESYFGNLSWKQTLAQANGKLWGGGAGGRGLFPFVKIMIYQ